MIFSIIYIINSQYSILALSSIVGMMSLVIVDAGLLLSNWLNLQRSYNFLFPLSDVVEKLQQLEDFKSGYPLPCVSFFEKWQPDAHN